MCFCQLWKFIFLGRETHEQKLQTHQKQYIIYMNIKQQNNSKYRINLIKNPTKAELIFIDKLKQKNILWAV